MNDLIDRQAAIDALNKLKIYRPLDSDRYVISDCLNKIVNLPSAQPEIIRCKDCKHWAKTCGDNQWSLGDCGLFEKHLVMCKRILRVGRKEVKDG
jgi:hypothetical protein